MLVAVLALVALLPAARAPAASDAPSDTESTIDTYRELEEIRSGLMEDNYDYEQMYPRHGEGGLGESGRGEERQTSSPLPDRFAIVRNADDSRHPEQDVNYNFTRHSNKNNSGYSEDFGYREVRRQIEDQRLAEMTEGERELQNKTSNMQNATKENTPLYPEMRRPEEKVLVQRSMEGNRDYHNKTHNNTNNQKTIKKERASVYQEVKKQKIEERTPAQGRMEDKQMENKTNTTIENFFEQDNASQYPEIKRQIVEDRILQ